MHRLKSTTSIYRFRFAALLLCAKCVALPAALGLMVAALIDTHHALARLGLAVAGVTLLLTLLQWLVAARSGCPLCLTPVLALKGCVTHRHARAFLGSHRLRVALSILLRNSFQCPYCHEPTLLEVRSKSRRSKT